MCGRFTLRTAPAEFWPAEQLSLFTPRYNIAPTHMVAAVRLTGGVRQAAQLQWGLVPYWADDVKIGHRMINARCETIAEKSAFRSAFQRRRCLVLADGYFEWRSVGKQKQPHYIRMRDERPFAFAGLWESWRGTPSRRREERLETCTIMTTAANELTCGVHDRMPVILRTRDHTSWLDPEFQSEELLKRMCQPYASDEMTIYPVSSIVNKPDNDVPQCVERVPEQGTLF